MPRRGVRFPSRAELLGAITSHGPSREFYTPLRKERGLRAETACPSAAGPVVDLASLSVDGLGNFTTNDNVNSAGVFATSSTTLSYQVASNGRVTLAGTSTPPILYLYAPNQGFLLGTDANVTFGILEPQTGGPFSDASFSGAYILGT